MVDCPRQVICIKWGRKFGPEYVNHLYGMISRNLPAPFALHCFTDSTEDLRAEVICHPIPELGCDLPEHTRGKWRKMVLWGRELAGLTGPAVFMDLDTVITGPLEEFFTFGRPEDVILARNWLRPMQKLGQTSFFRFPVGGNPQVLEHFCSNAQEEADHYKWEQHYVTATIGDRLKFWPDSWIRHYRHHCLGPWPLRYLRAARLPAGTRVVVFPGDPNPHDALIGQWEASEGPVSAWRHLLNTRSGKMVKDSRYAHIKAFNRPCPWIAQHWRD